MKNRKNMFLSLVAAILPLSIWPVSWLQYLITVFVRQNFQSQYLIYRNLLYILMGLLMVIYVFALKHLDNRKIMMISGVHLVILVGFFQYIGIFMRLFPNSALAFITVYGNILVDVFAGAALGIFMEALYICLKNRKRRGLT